MLSNIRSLSGVYAFLLHSAVHFPIQQKGLWEQEKQEEDQFCFCLAADALRNAEISHWDCVCAVLQFNGFGNKPRANCETKVK